MSITLISSNNMQTTLRCV